MAGRLDFDWNIYRHSTSLQNFIELATSIAVSEGIAERLVERTTCVKQAARCGMPG
jgi:hypothetical protein